MQPLSVTAATAAIFALMMVLLSAMTSLRRAKLKTSFGDAGDETLRRRIRAHGNFVEYAPMALILLGLVEAFGATRATVCWLALAFCLARALHALGMLFMTRPLLKAIGMALQHTAFVFAAVLLLRRAIG